jgi:AAA ATPase domain
MSDSSDTAPQVARARQFAALSGPFSPATALHASGVEMTRPDAAVLVASQLAAACDTRAEPDGSKWLMRSPERRWQIDSLRTLGQLEEAIAWRREQADFDAPAQDLTAALLATDVFDPATLERRLATADNTTDELSSAELERLASALEWAGPAARAFGQLHRIRAVLNRATQRKRLETVLPSDPVGRENERAALASWIAKPTTTPPVQARFVVGPKGSGKSTLLELALSDASRAGRSLIVVRLNFEYATLDVLDQVGLTLEVARQVAAQIPEQASAIRARRLEAAGGSEDAVKGRGRNVFPSDLAQELGAAVTASGLTVVIALDGLEHVQARGATHPKRLFEWLDNLLATGMSPMSVIAASQDVTLAGVPVNRINQAPIALEAVPPHTADHLLDQLQVPAERKPTVQAFAKNNSLLLLLGGTLAAQSGEDALPKLSGGVSSVARQLLNRLLSQLADRDLRKLVNGCLLLRRVNHEILRKVVAPALGLRIDDVRATDQINTLAKHVWLVKPDSHEGWLKLRRDLRAQTLPVLYERRPVQCARIDRLAAEWFEAREEPWLKLEGLYHRLQLTRRDAPLPELNYHDARQIDADTLAELPQAAVDAVRQARGERSAPAQPSAPRKGSPSPIDDRAAKDMQIVIERGDWDEAADLYARAFENAIVEPASAGGNAARTFLWRVGRWRQAKKSLDALDAVRPGDTDLNDIATDDALARLEMRAELSFADFVARLANDKAYQGLAERIAGRGAKTDMSIGALGFAIYAASSDPNSFEPSGRRANPIGAVEELWGGATSRAALDNAVSVAKELMLRWVSRATEAMHLPPPDTSTQTLCQVVSARCLAGLSPYVNPISLLARFDHRGRLTAHATSVVRQLAGIDAWWNGCFAGVGEFRGTDTDSPIEILSDLGLLAEWAGAAAFVQRHADLALVARSAETWRGVAAGQWVYGRGRRNAGSLVPANLLDASIWVRVRELLAATDPVARSRDILNAWAGPAKSETERSGDAVIARLTVPLRQAKAAAANRERNEAALAAAGAALQSGTPSAFVPALGVLIAFNAIPGGS